MPDDSWVKLYRSVDRAGWRKNPSILSVYVWVLTHVHMRDQPFAGAGGITLGRGQVAASIGEIADDCGLTYDGAKYALRVLSKAGDIRVEHVSRSVRITLMREEATPRSLPRSTPRSSPISQEPETSTVSTLEDTSQSRSLPRSLPRSSPGTIPDPYTLYTRIEQEYPQDTLSYSPSQEEVQTYFRERGYRRDPSQFYSYNAMRGWGRIRDWRAAADLWESHGDAKPTQKDQEESSSIDWDSVHQMVLEVPVFRKGDQKK